MHLAWLLLAIATAAREPYPSPESVALAPDGRLLAVGDPAAGVVSIVDTTAGRVLRSLPAPQVGALVWSAEGQLYATLGATRRVVRLDPARGRTLAAWEVGARPVGLALAARRGRLLAACADSRELALVDLAGSGVTRLPTSGEPFAVACTPDESMAVVTNLIPSGPATDDETAAVVDLVDLATAKPIAAFRLPTGATNVRQVAVSPDGRWAYVAHIIGRFHLPTTQTERGWINTNALTVLDLTARRVYATLLLDHPLEGAADPWGVAVAADGRTLFVTLAGVHKLARLDLARLHEMLDGKLPADSWWAKTSMEWSLTAQNTWLEIKREGRQRALLVNDLTALHGAELIRWHDLPGQGPRGLALLGDGRVAVALHFANALALADATTGKPVGTIALGTPREPDLVRRGEQWFHDATASFQHWHSCATCHPNHGRVDGLNWDLLNDGLGNPKNTRSLLWADRITPLMSHGVRASLPAATQAGFEFIHFRQPTAAQVDAVTAYIQSLTPVLSPWLGADGRPTAVARRGQALFADRRVGCASCHPAPLFSDQRLHDVGTRSPVDTSGEFVTPTLVEAWRTGPYLHDGRSAALRDVLTRDNGGDRHGATAHLTREQIGDLVAYLLTL